MNSILEKIIHKPYWFLLSLMILVFAIYGYTIDVGYISDDWGFVYQVENYGWSAFQHNFTDKFFIPLSHFFGVLMYQIAGGKPWIQHAVQLVVHAVVAWQIFLLFKDIAAKNQSLVHLSKIGLLTTVLFLLNPYQTETVVWLAAKSYGYSLFFMLLSLRVLINNPSQTKTIFLFCFTVFIAIHTKEWAYVAPFVGWILLWMTHQKIHKSFYWGSILTIVSALLIRHLALGQLVGGYENVNYTDLGRMSLGVLMYIGKFITFFRFGSTEFLPIPLLFAITILLGSACIFICIKYRISWKILLGVFMILVFSILPVSTLELVSFFETQSDRYSYLALIPFSFILAYIIYNLQKIVGLITLIFTLVFFVFFTISQNNIWKTSSQLQYTFLEDLLEKVEDNSSVFLYNIPDTYKGVYCIRNGIEPYLKVHGKVVDIEIYQRQSFYDVSGGVQANKDHEYLPYNAENTYTTYPKDVITINEITFEWQWIKDFNQSFYFHHQTFYKLEKLK